MKWETGIHWKKIGFNTVRRKEYKECKTFAAQAIQIAEILESIGQDDTQIWGTM